MSGGKSYELYLYGCVEVRKAGQHFGAEEACWAHNPKVVGSKPTSATVTFFDCPHHFCSLPFYYLSVIRPISRVFDDRRSHTEVDSSQIYKMPLFLTGV